MFDLKILRQDHSYLFDKVLPLNNEEMNSPELMLS